MPMKTNVLVVETSKTTRQQIIRTMMGAKLTDQVFEAENGLIVLHHRDSDLPRKRDQ